MAENATQKNTPQAEPVGKKKLCTFTVSFSSVTTLCMVLLGGIAWAFFMGVIVGRGEHPQTAMPELTTLAAEKTDPAATPELMQPKDLNYAASLKNTKTQAPAGIVAKAPATAKDTKKDATTDATTEGTLPSAATERAGALESELPDTPKLQLFDYVFQVATFGNEEAVDTLRADLEGDGLRTRMERLGKWYRVMVLLRGTEEQAQDLRQHLLRKKLGEPLQRGKIPVQ